MYTSGGQAETARKVTRNNVKDVESLKSNQEEADSKIILHCIYVARKGAKILLCETQT